MIHIDVTLPLDRFDLRVRAEVGGTVAVLGPSGAGKTSLVEAIAGLRRASGRLAVGERVLLDSAAGIDLPPERRGVGWVPQEGALFPHLSVLGNLLYGARRRAADEAAHAGAPADLAAVVESLELTALVDARPSRLSGGERRRVALGRALLSAPSVLLVDEPTSGLDARRARQALQCLRAVTERHRVPLVVVTHREEEARALAADVIVLDAGRVVGAGPTHAVLGRADVLSQRAEEPTWNVVAGHVLRHEPALGVTLVAWSGGEEVAIPLHEDLRVGGDVVIGVEAEEVLVAVEPPRGLSARNVVAGHVDALVAVGSSVYVDVGPWRARLTRAAARDLALEVGHPAWLVVKTHAWRVVAGRAVALDNPDEAT